MSDRYLLPPNATPQEVAVAGTVARISDVPVPLRGLYRPASCPEVLLPWLAWSFSLDQWDTSWTEAQKRASIENSVFVHRHKGTIGAVRSALAALGIGARVQEWFNQTPAGAPYTYRLLLDVDQVGISQENVLRVDDVVEATKNLRSHLDKIVMTISSAAPVTVAAACGVGTEIDSTGYGYSLIADGSVIADGTYRANGFKVPIAQ
jgi:phage tail P2-like protein